MKITLQHFYWAGLKNTYDVPPEKYIYVLTDDNKIICEIHKPILEAGFKTYPTEIRRIYKTTLEELDKYLSDNELRYEIAEDPNRAWNVYKKGKPHKIKGGEITINHEFNVENFRSTGATKDRGSQSTI